MAIGLENAEIQIYDFKRMKTIKTILAHSSFVSRLHLLSNGKLLSGSGKGDINLWEVL